MVAVWAGDILAVYRETLIGILGCKTSPLIYQQYQQDGPARCAGVCSPYGLTFERIGSLVMSLIITKAANSSSSTKAP